jgi:hypothetical protein
MLGFGSIKSEHLITESEVPMSSYRYSPGVIIFIGTRVGAEAEEELGEYKYLKF